MQKLSEYIEQIAAYDFESHKVFGSCYFVYHKGSITEKCYGTTSLNTETPVTNTTLFRLASMTKPITTVAACILMERGLLSLNDRVDQFLPAFKNIKIIDEFGKESIPKAQPTIHNLLTHTSGIGSLTYKLNKLTPPDKASLDGAVSFFAKQGLDFEPGTMQYYSGTGAFDVLAKIIEIVTGEDYLSFLQREIFQPCDMHDTTFLPNDEQTQRLIAMHCKESGQNGLYSMPAGCVFEDFPATHYLGGAGLVSTLHDYCNFAQMLLQKGQAKHGKILQEASIQMLSSPQLPGNIMPGDTRWGLGVRVIADDTHPWLPKGCFGWSGAYGSHFWIDPTNNLFAVYMKNSKFDGGAANDSATRFEQAVYRALNNEPAKKD